MIHQPMGGAQGQAEDIKVEAAQIVRIKENLVKLYSMMTGQTTDQIIKDLDRDNFMSAQEVLFGAPRTFDVRRSRRWRAGGAPDA